jgi:Subtilase family
VCVSVAAESALAVPSSQRPAGLPPLSVGTGDVAAMSASDQELVVAAHRRPLAGHILRAAGASRLSERAGLWLVPARATSVVGELSRLGLLRYAHPNTRRSDFALGTLFTDPLSHTQWWLNRIGADRVPAAPPGVPVTVIDSGVDTGHPEFAGRQIEQLNAPIVDTAHGTQVASVAAAPTNGQGIVGVYPQALLRSYDEQTRTCAGSIAALDAATRVTAPSVLNISWGFAAPGCAALYDEVIVAKGLGHLVVAAVGNFRAQNNPSVFPAVFPHVLTVGATDQADNVASFSSNSSAIDVAAPGVGIMAAAPFAFNAAGWGEVMGTSYSAPIVAATAAWVWTQRRSQIRAPGQVADLIRYSARDVGVTGWDADAGWGIVDINAAMTRAVPGADPQEPNDDIDQVRAGGLFRTATVPLTSRGRGRATVVATLDWFEDPVDVYRAWVPGRRVVSFSVKPTANVDLEIFTPRAKTVYYQNRRAALRGSLFGGSYRLGKASETFVVRNKSRRGMFVYVCAYKARLDNLFDALYTLNIRTRRR